MAAEVVESVDDLQARLEAVGYLAESSLATAAFLAQRLGRPLLLEGEAGVGKTELAKALAAVRGSRLIRLQCYEGLDLSAAVYEWDYARQLLELRLLEAGGKVDPQAARRQLFGPDFLLERPLLQALRSTEDISPVLLVDELDRADEEFEAFLLEILSDFQVTIPELGTLRAERPPLVVLTSNRTREVHDALRRRCLYHWIDYPSFDKELDIVRAKRPEIGASLSRQVVEFVQLLRQEDLYKRPGVAETLDWASALDALDRTALDPEAIGSTLGALLKYQDDIEQVRGATVDRTLAQMAKG